MRRRAPRLRARLRRSDRGAAAVEFALLLPVLILIVLGIMEFGRAYNVQLGLTAGAREGVRVMSIDNDRTATRTATRAAGPGVTPAIPDADIKICTTATSGAVPVCTSAVCTPGATVSVTVTYQMVFLTTMLGNGPKLTGKGVMRCNG